MLRRFRRHDIRMVQDLRGVWDFAFLGDVDPDDANISEIAFDDRMAVPGSFDATPKYAGHRGLAAYRTYAYVRDASPHRLVLDGVHHWARVFAGGRKIRDHVGGFTRFDCDIAADRAGEIEILVLVDNRIDYERCPLHLDYFDWYHFGGITRGAELHRLGSTWIDAVVITTEDVAARRLALKITCRSMAASDAVPLSIHVGDRPVLEEKVAVASGETVIERGIELTGAALWSPREPRLHEIAVRLGTDDVRERVGIRQVRVDGRKILVNGEPVRLLGFNRHEIHPHFGHGLPDAVNVIDVQQLLDMNCNFVRGSHYPQDVRFLDLCDEAGLCVWCEPTAWQPTAEHLTDEKFLEAQLNVASEMVASAVNHPSVVMWGALNEGHSDDEKAKAGYAKVLNLLKGADPTRPVTYATCRPFKDVCYDLADIISVNCYPGWYGASIDEIPAAIDKIVAHVDASGQGDKPLIISEIGAGAIYGWRDWNETRWSEQYQVKLLETVIRHLFVDRDRFAGLSIWLYGDFRTSQQTGRALGRPRAFNNKGVVDEYRRPKMGYEVVKRMFGELSPPPR